MAGRESMQSWSLAEDNRSVAGVISSTSYSRVCYELSNEIAIGRAAHHLRVRVGGRLRRDALRAGGVRSDRYGTHGSPGCTIQERIRAARGGDRATGKKHRGSKLYRTHGH